MQDSLAICSVKLNLISACTCREPALMQSAEIQPLWIQQPTLEPCMTQTRGSCPGFQCSLMPYQSP